jgi:hypothetical protein
VGGAALRYALYHVGFTNVAAMMGMAIILARRHERRRAVGRGAGGDVPADEFVSASLQP